MNNERGRQILKKIEKLGGDENYGNVGLLQMVQYYKEEGQEFLKIISCDISIVLNQSKSMISLNFHQLQYLNNQIYMNQQISQEHFIQKFSSLYLSETDDDTSRSESPVLDSRLMEFMSGLPTHIKIKLENFKPSQNFQLSKQNDGSIYFGMMEESLKHGVGIQLWPKIGNLLKGTWQNDLLEGVCIMFYSNGDIFEAQFQQGITIGFGMFKSEKKIVKGIWINNQLQGEGQEIKSDGTTYYGQFWDGRKQGRGIQIFTDGCKYEGFFQNNKFEGDGIFTWSDGSYYQGQFHRGLIRGFGNYNNNNGLQLMGQFQEFKKTELAEQNLNKNLQTITFLNQYNQTLLIEKIRIL